MFTFQTKIENLRAQSLFQEQMGRFSSSSTESPTDGTFSFGFISKQPRLALYSAFDSAPAQAGITK